MAINTKQRSPSTARASSPSSDNQSSHSAAAIPSEEELTSLFDEAMTRSSAASSPDAAPSPSGTAAKPITKDEQQKFLKAMQEPEFRSLLSDYMKEISDPANRAETEKYLAQLENEQRVPEDKLLIKPSPGFVVKTKWLEQNEKLFVNICSSEKLQPPSSTKIQGSSTGNSKSGTSWSLPYSVGPERMEHDKAGSMAITYDVCFHPRTLQFATMQKPYRDMVVKTCLDAIEPLVRKSQNKMDGHVSREYRVLKGVLYKSGEPVTMCLTTTPSAAPASPPATNNKNKKPQEPTTSKPIERLEPTNSSYSEQEENSIRHTKQETVASKKPLIQEVSESQASPPTTAPSSLPALEYRIIYRGKFEMMDHMQGSLNTTPATAPAAANRPRELVVEISFPTFSSAKGIHLDVNDKAVKIHAHGYSPLDISLPFAVLETKGSAKFDKKARKLVVTLPVQAPEPPVVVSRMAIQEEEEDQEEEEKEEKEEVEEKEASPVPTTRETSSRPPPPQATDAFAMLRETALMVANDPFYLPREESPVPAVEVDVCESGKPTTSSLDEKIHVHIANDASYDDLPPLESCSEDEGDEGEGDHEEGEQREQREQSTASVVEAAVAKVETRTTPAFTIKETPTCCSYLVEVAGVDPTSVQLVFPTLTSFRFQFGSLLPEAPPTEHFQQQLNRNFEVCGEQLLFEIDQEKCEYDIATENVVLILHKKKSGEPKIVETVPPTTTPTSTPTTTTTTPNLTPTTAPATSTPTFTPAPVVRFQNDLLYELD